MLDDLLTEAPRIWWCGDEWDRDIDVLCQDDDDRDERGHSETTCGERLLVNPTDLAKLLAPQ